MKGPFVSKISSKSVNNIGNLKTNGKPEFFLPVGEKADILWRCTAVSANNSEIDAGFEILHNPID